MGISKSIWMAQSELDQINEDINLSDDEYFDRHYIERTSQETQRLQERKAYNEKELSSLTILAKKFGLVGEGN